ncbi:tetratricopeptide TPR_3 (plasmid) [Planktothrix agardhii NIES-204]|jgi:CHAT domain-containing protein/Tfp pilus assembly protein PilF|nr:tetratricopeptide TPR_3 [Planktothrix agardhii NIES-204]
MNIEAFYFKKISYLLLAVTIGVNLNQIVSSNNSPVLAQSNITQNESDHLEQLLQQGQRQFQQSQYQEALVTYQQALVLSQKLNNQLKQAEILYNLGTVHRFVSEYHQAVKLLNQALDIVKSISGNKKTSLLGRISSEIGVNYYNLSQYPEALKWYQQGLTISREVRDRQLESLTLDHIGVVKRRQGNYQEALSFHEQALDISQEINDISVQARIFNNIGIVYDLLGEYDKSLAYDNQGLTISRRMGDRYVESRILNSMGVVYANQGLYPQALDYYKQALVIERQISNKSEEGRTINNIASVYDSKGDYPKALQYYQQALAITREIGDRIGEGITLGNMGAVYRNLGQYQTALDYFQQSLTLSKDIGDYPGEAYILSSIASVYYTQGKYGQALDYFQQALAVRKEIGEIAGQGYSLNSIGGVYHILGEYEQALTYFQQALTIRRQIGDQAGEGQTLNNIGLVYNLLKKSEAALTVYQQSLAIRQQIGDQAGEAHTLNDIGSIYQTKSDYNQALDYYKQALSIREQIGDITGEGVTLNNLGKVYQNLGQQDQALNSYQQALAIFRENGNRPGESSVLANIGEIFQQKKQIPLAITFYKQAVNVTEAIRQDLAGLPFSQKQSYTATVADTYRHLADLLLQEDRVLEAQQVLDLLKIQELDDYLHNVRGNQETVQGVELLPQEQKLLDNYGKIEQNAIALGQELVALRQIKPEARKSSQNERIAQLEQQQQQIRQDFNDFINSPEVIQLTQQLSQTTGGQNLDLPNLNRLQRQLGQLPQSTVILYPLILEDRLELVLVTPYSPPIHRTVAIDKTNLNRAILDFRTKITDRFLPNSQIQPSAYNLYQLLIQPIAQDLQKAKVQHIIYAPDGQLRYIPLAALYDGKQWLIENYTINNVTSASLSDFTAKNPEKPHILAGAFTQGQYNVQVGQRQLSFNGLPYAGQEVTTIAATIPDTMTLLDKNFNPQTTLPQLNDHNIIHFATHASFMPGNPDDSFILFGNGDRLTLKDIETLNLTAVDLVVLSACQTGVGGNLGNGEEILGLGYQMQLAGAATTMASLWTVDDQGTQILMADFYNNIKSGKFTKSEALQQAQISLIKNQSLNHPYFWSAFILIGNGQ